VNEKRTKLKPLGFGPAVKASTRVLTSSEKTSALVSERLVRDRLESGLCCVLEYLMAPRANWKGFLRLSLVTCPVALYPATSDSEKISFNQMNRKTGHPSGSQQRLPRARELGLRRPPHALRGYPYAFCNCVPQRICI